MQEAQRRCKAEQHADDERQSEVEQQNARVGMRSEGQFGGRVSCDPACQEGRDHRRHRQSERAAEKSQQQPFHEQLPNDLPTAGAHGIAH